MKLRNTCGRINLIYISDSCFHRKCPKFIIQSLKKCNLPRSVCKNINTHTFRKKIRKFAHRSDRGKIHWWCECVERFGLGCIITLEVSPFLLYTRVSGRARLTLGKRCELLTYRSKPLSTMSIKNKKGITPQKSVLIVCGLRMTFACFLFFTRFLFGYKLA